MRDSVILHTLPSCIVQKDSNDGKKKKDTTAIKAAQVYIILYLIAGSVMVMIVW